MTKKSKKLSKLSTDEKIEEVLDTFDGVCREHTWVKRRILKKDCIFCSIDAEIPRMLSKDLPRFGK
jgi:hypothetical protein